MEIGTVASSKVQGGEVVVARMKALCFLDPRSTYGEHWLVEIPSYLSPSAIIISV